MFSVGLGPVSPQMQVLFTRRESYQYQQGPAYSKLKSEI